MTIGGTLVKIYTDEIKKQVGTADIVVAEGERAEYKYFSMEPAMTIANKVEYIIGGVIGHGYYNGKDGEKTVDLYGIDLNDMQTFNPIQCWANDINNDDAFAIKSVTPILLNRFFCQADAETMIGEGRYWGAQFFTQLGKEQDDIAGLCFEAADFLNKTSEYAQQMTAIRQGERQTEEAVWEFAGKYIRKEIGALIIKAKESERKAIEVIEKIMNRLS